MIYLVRPTGDMLSHNRLSFHKNMAIRLILRTATLRPFP